MRIIERKWTDLSLGHQAVQNLQSRLEGEFGRAVEVGHKQKYRRELTEWQKKRRIFFALVVLAPLSVIALCLTIFYFREVACVLAWWLVTVVLIILALAVAGWNFIREMVSGRPVPQRARITAGLAERWWESLSPKSLALGSPDQRGETNFLTLLARSLPDDWLAVRGLLASAPAPSDTDILLLGPSGLWLFEVRHWSGSIGKQEGVWKRTHRKREETLPGQSPDDQWVRQRDEILKTVQTRLPHLAWTSDLLHGGMVFSHPKAELRQPRIQGNTAAYGPARAWLERLRQSEPDVRFILEVRLEILDALITSTSRGDKQTEYASSKEEAERLYEQVAGQLREYVAKMVK
ncbi:MAG: nuclease-related domain-containing protein [Chloroflexota bacterium]